jgi:putative PEP-CTERM system histidine kinase
VTANNYAIAALWSYGLALVGYIVFAARIALGSPKGARAVLLLAALAFTALWAASSLPLGFAGTPIGLFIADSVDALRYAAWFAFLGQLINHSQDAGTLRALPRGAVLAVGAMLVASVWLGQGQPVFDIAGFSSVRMAFIAHLGMAVVGLMLVEQLVRRVPPRMRWSIKPLALALAGVFGLDLFFYADATMLGHLDADIWLSRGLANFIVIPFIAIATARNTGWTVDLHLSRGAVFHSTALLLSGAFLLIVAGAGYVLRYFGGDWGRALQIELLFAAALFVVLVFTSGTFRSRLKVFVSKHFFSYRYDYREEWLRFTRTLSTASANQSLQMRTVIALADLVESPAGCLWLKDEARGFVPAARWNTPATDCIEPLHGHFGAFLERTNWIVSLPEYKADSSRYDALRLPAWMTALDWPWLVVPLVLGTEVLGFVVLGAPRTPVEIDWEVRDLLRAASRQAASYLGQVMADEALIEARKFDAFNRMSAFVVHDLKNLVAQLSLMLKNAQRHRDNPAFQLDMLSTVEHVVGRMNGMMLQLRIGTQPVENVRHVQLDAVLRRACAAKSASPVRINLERAEPLVTLGHEDRLERVIGHLLQNAIDASEPSGLISVRLEPDERFALIAVSDNGIGMTPEFIRDCLFKPFQTTKPSGMGIGVYESAQYIAGLGGEMRVDSRPGDGTDVRVRLPRIDPFQDAASPALNEAAA